MGLFNLYLFVTHFTYQNVLFSRYFGNHLEERWLDQAEVRASYTPLFGVVRVAYPKA